MISLEKLMILAPLQKLPKNVGDLGKGFKKLPKVQKIANSGHTGHNREIEVSLYGQSLSGHSVGFELRSSE